MRLGASLFLIAVGAILKFAIKDHFKDVNLSTIGLILMLIGALGLVITLVVMSMRRRTDVIHRGPGGTSGTTYVTPNDPVDGPY